MPSTPVITPQQGAQNIHDVLKDVKRVRGTPEPIGQIFRDKSGSLGGIDALGRKVADVLDRVLPDKHGEAMDIYSRRGDATHTIHRRKAEGDGTEITIEKKPAAFTP